MSHSPEGLHPAVNVEDVDNEKAEAEKGRGGEEKSDIPQIPSNQDTKLTTLTVPVTPSGGRQRWAAAVLATNHRNKAFNLWDP